MNEEAVVWLLCFVFYLIADGASFTVYTKRAQLEQRRLVVEHSHIRVPYHTPESKHYPENTSCVTVYYTVTVQLWL